MEAQFWHQRWDKGEIGFHQHSFNPHLTRFWYRVPIAHEAPVFVPLCGKSQDMLWLRGEGHPVLGVEISALAVAAFFADNALPPQRGRQGAFDIYEHGGIQLLCGDFFDLTCAHLAGIGAVYDRASLIALPPELRGRYAEHLCAILPPATPMLLVTLDYDQGAMAGPPFAVSEQEVRSLYGSHFAIDNVFSHDLLQGEEEERWRSRGIAAMSEQVYLLTAR